MSTSSLDQLELQLEELEASADPQAAEQKFSAPWRRKPGSQLTRRWRGRDSNPRSPGLGEVVADELTDSGRPPDEAPRIMASAGWPEDSAPQMARITGSSPRRPVSPGSGHRSPHFLSSTVSSSIA